MRNLQYEKSLVNSVAFMLIVRETRKTPNPVHRAALQDMLRELAGKFLSVSIKEIT